MSIVCRADMASTYWVTCTYIGWDWCDAIGIPSMLSVPSQCVSLIDMSSRGMAFEKGSGVAQGVHAGRPKGRSE